MNSNLKTRLLSVFADLSLYGFSVGVDFNGFQPAWAHSTYPEDWIERYVEKGYVAKDATIKHGTNYEGHFSWEQLRELYPDDPVLRDAHDFGLKEGNTLSIRINGRSSIVSCCGPVWNEVQVQEATGALAGLHEIGRASCRERC